MLNKNHRLTSYSAFVATYRQRNLVSDENLVLYGGKLKDSDKNYPTRVGFVVSKKIHKRAVKRNRIKRLMRASYANLLKNREISGSQKFQSLIFIANPNSLNIEYKQMCSSVKQLIDNLAIKNI